MPSDLPAHAATMGTFFFAFGTEEISAIIVGSTLRLNPFVHVMRPLVLRALRRVLPLD